MVSSHSPEGPRKVPAPTQGYSALVLGAALSQGAQPWLPCLTAASCLTFALLSCVEEKRLEQREMAQTWEGAPGAAS